MYIYQYFIMLKNNLTTKMLFVGNKVNKINIFNKNLVVMIEIETEGLTLKKLGISDKNRLISLTAEEDESCELGYWLGFEYWRRGYATEACNAQA